MRLCWVDSEGVKVNPEKHCGVGDCAWGMGEGVAWIGSASWLTGQLGEYGNGRGC